MNCDNYLEMLSARLDGALTEAEERELEAHLASCPACRAAEAQLRALRAAFTGLEDVPAPEGLARDVMERVREPEPRKSVPLFRRPLFKALAGLAACGLLAVGLYGAVRPLQQDWDQITLSCRQGALEEDGNVSAEEILRSVPDFSVPVAGLDKAAPAGGPENTPGPRKSVPDAAVYDASDYDGADTIAAVPTPDTEVLVVDRMPEGGWELIPPETPISADGLRVTGELMEQIQRMAQDQGITASITSGTKGAELHLIVVLNETE